MKTSTSTTSYRGLKGLRRAFATPSALAILFLGFGSGLPFLLVGGTLSTFLRDAGLSLQTIGYVSYAGLFYALKFLWAPLIDLMPAPVLRKLGRRRSWLVLSQLALAVGLGGMAWATEGHVVALVVLTAFSALAGATQDVVVDAYRIEVGTPESQAALAAMYSLGYRLALMASGAGVLYVAEFFSWKVAYGVMALLMLLPLVATLLSPEPPKVDMPRASVVQPFTDFFRRNGLVGLALLLFVGLYKFPDQLIGVMTGPFYLDCGYSKAEIATVSKVLGIWVSLLGAFLGGAGVAVFRMRTMLWVGAVLVAFSNLAFLVMAKFPAPVAAAVGQPRDLVDLWPFVVAILADNLSQGIAGTVLVAFMSSLTSRRFSGSQYALLVSLANLPGKLVAGVSGRFVDMTSYSVFFASSIATVIPTLLMLFLLRRFFLEGENGELEKVEKTS